MKRNVKNGVVFMLVMMMAAGVFAPGGAGLTEEVYGAEKATNTKSMKRIQGNWTDYAAKRFASGDGTRARPYRIESRAQLALLSKIVNESGETSDGYTKFHYYQLAADIDLSAHYWTPVGRIRGSLFSSVLRGKAFRGHFDGKGHIIRGLTTKKTESSGGLFGIVGEITEASSGTSGAEFVNEKAPELGQSTRRFVPAKDYSRSKGESAIVTNVHLSEARIEGRSYAGGIAGYLFAAAVTRCSVAGRIRGKTYAGGIVGRCFESDLKDNRMSGSVYSDQAAGGLVGVFYGIDGGRFRAGPVHATVRGGVNVGGLIGKYDRFRGGDAALEFRAKDLHQVKVVGKTNVGGAIGYFEHQYLEKERKGTVPKQLPVALTHIYVKGSVSGKKNTGGLIGFEGGQNASQSGFEGKVNGRENTGGLVGYRRSGIANAGRITRCYVKAKVTGQRMTGGFFGNIQTVYNIVIGQSWFGGTLQGVDRTGGFLGMATCNDVNITLKNVYVTGRIKGGANTGGMFGTVAEDGLRFVNIRSSYGSAKVEGQSGGGGIIFGQPLNDYHTKLVSFYYNSGKNPSGKTGIVSSGPDGVIFGKATPVDPGRLAREKLAGFNEKKIWARTKPKGKSGNLPQLRFFVKSKNKNLRSVSAASTRIPAYYKVTYDGRGGKTASGKNAGRKYIRYNALKKASLPAFSREGYIPWGVSARSPKKLPKVLKNDKTKVGIRWKSVAGLVPAPVIFSAVRTGDQSVRLRWTRQKMAKGYGIQISEHRDGPFRDLASLAGGSRDEYTAQGLQWNKRYFFRMYARNIVKKTSIKGGMSVVREAGILKPVNQTEVSAKNRIDGSVELTLTPGDCHGYEIRRSATPEGVFTVACDLKAEWILPENPVYVVADAEIGKPYYYKVFNYRIVDEAKGIRVWSEDGNRISATAKPPKGVIHTITEEGAEGAKLFIKNYFCSGYDIYRAGPAPSGTFQQVRTITLNGSGADRIITEGGPHQDDFAVWSDRGLSPGEYRYYVVPFEDGYGVKASGIAGDPVSIRIP